MLFGNKPLLREEYWGWEGGGGYVEPAKKKANKKNSASSNTEIVKFLLEMNNIPEVVKPLTLQEELNSIKDTEKLKEHKSSKFGIKL